MNFKGSCPLGLRVGFENSMLMPDGRIAPNNETKVKVGDALLKGFGFD